MRALARSLTAILLGCMATGAAPDLAAQEALDPATPHVRLHLSPYLGAGARGEIADLVGPQVYAGAHLEADLGGRIRPVVNGAGWAFPLTCTPSGDPSRDRMRCADGGWMADAGANLRFASRGKLFTPYIGAGLGAMKVGDVFAAANARIGSDIWSRSGVGFRAELRYQQVFGASDPGVVLFSGGARFELPRF